MYTIAKYSPHEESWTQVLHQLWDAVGQQGSCNGYRDENLGVLVVYPCHNFHEMYW